MSALTAAAARISTPLLIALMCEFVGSVLLPLLLILYLYRHTFRERSGFVAGAVTFFVSALVLESAVHSLVLLRSPAGAVIQSNLYLYALYGASMAAIFEETGRLIAFHLLNKSGGQLQKSIALTYGAGHGVCECILLVTFNALSNFILCLLLRTGHAQLLTQFIPEGSEDTLALLSTQITALIETPLPSFFLALLERASAMTAHISMSIVVWKCVSEKRPGYFFLAMAMHFALDFTTVILSSLTSIYITELAITLLAVLFALFARRIYTGMPAYSAYNSAYNSV